MLHNRVILDFRENSGARTQSSRAPEETSNQENSSRYTCKIRLDEIRKIYYIVTNQHQQRHQRHSTNAVTELSAYLQEQENYTIYNKKVE